MGEGVMSDSKPVQASRKRRANNEIVFRERNRHIEDAVVQVFDNDQRETFPLEFYCECSNPDCIERLSLTADEYDQAHQDSFHFTITPEHNEPELEDVVTQRNSYWQVQKKPAYR
jgi:hypothetical protein